jgi:hypothetical protein
MWASAAEKRVFVSLRVSVAMVSLLLREMPKAVAARTTTAAALAKP